MPQEPVNDQAEDEDEDATDLPERDALSLLDPSKLIGGGVGLPVAPTQPGAGSGTPGGIAGTPAPTGTPTAPTTPPLPGLPPLPDLPHDNPGGTYQPDASSSNTSKP